jgi:undecaprenyl-diphosphatase
VSGQKLPARHAVALGLIQGPAELLPISSSSHTALIPWLMRWRCATLDVEQRRSLEVALHAGTAAALVLSGVAEVPLRRPFSRLMLLAVVPPACAGYLLERFIDRRLSSPATIAFGLLLGAAGMAAADGPAAGGRRAQDAGALDGLLLGLAQVTALAPGVSRNGATLAVARARGFSRADADALSWQVGVPVIAGAAVLKLARARWSGQPARVKRALAAGAASAFASTLLGARAIEAGRERVSARRRAHGEHGPARAPGRLAPYAAYRVGLALLVIGRLRQDRARRAAGRLPAAARRRTAAA